MLSTILYYENVQMALLLIQAVEIFRKKKKVQEEEATYSL